MKPRSNILDSYNFMNTFSLGNIDQVLDSFVLNRRKYSLDAKTYSNMKSFNAEEKIKILSKRFSLVNNLKQKFKNKRIKKRKLLNKINKNNLINKNKTIFSYYLTKRNSQENNQKIKSLNQERRQLDAVKEGINKAKILLPIFPSKIIPEIDTNDVKCSCTKMGIKPEIIKAKSKILDKSLIRRYSLINPEKLSIFSEKNKLNFISKIIKYFQCPTKRNILR